MKFVDLYYLTATTDAGTFSRAARHLGLTPSTVSRRVGRLEDELGLTLFERGHGGVRLTAGGKAVMPHVRRVLAELDAVKSTAAQNGSASVGEIRLGLRVPPVGEPFGSLMRAWRVAHPRILLKISELNDHDIAVALEERRLDVAFVPSFTLWPHAAALPIYRERLVAVLPRDHALACRQRVTWSSLREETILIQGWDESQAQREFLASFLGSGACFQVHAASKQSVFALVAAGFGISLAGHGQAETTFPGVVFKPMDEPDAWFRVDLAWMPEAEEPAVGCFVAFIRDEARLLNLL